jgi:hypothetical protein
MRIGIETHTLRCSATIAEMSVGSRVDLTVLADQYPESRGQGVDLDRVASFMLRLRHFTHLNDHQGM